MANIYGNKQYISNPAGYERMDRYPLEKNTVFESVARINQYIGITTANGGTAYAGQLLTTPDGNDIYKVYESSTGVFSVSGIIEKYLSRYVSGTTPFAISTLDTGDIYISNSEGGIYVLEWDDDEQDYVYKDLIESINGKINSQKLIMPVGLYENTRYPNLVDATELRLNVIYVTKNTGSTNEWDSYREWIISPEHSFWDRDNDDIITLTDIENGIQYIRNEATLSEIAALGDIWGGDSIDGIQAGVYTPVQWFKYITRNPEILYEEFGEFTVGGNISQLESDMILVKRDVSALKIADTSIRNNIDNISRSLSSTTVNITRINSDVSILKSDVSTLKHDVSVLQSTQQTLPENVVKYESFDMAELVPALAQHPGRPFSLKTILSFEGGTSFAVFRDLFFIENTNPDGTPYIPKPGIPASALIKFCNNSGYILPNISFEIGSVADPNITVAVPRKASSLILEWIADEKWWKMVFVPTNGTLVPDESYIDNPAVIYSSNLKTANDITPVSLD